MSQHRKSDHDVRKKKYAAQFLRTDANKKRNIAKMKEANPNWPERKKNGM